jgi:branched-chain amino acid transport system permease protein
LGLSFALADYHLRVLNLAVISAIAVVGLNFAFGAAGLISLGHAAFVGMGAYGDAILTTRWGFSPWFAMPDAIVLTTLFAAAIGYSLLRLKGHYLALATLGLNVSFYIVSANWVDLTGGTNGISGIPEIAFAHHAISGERGFLWCGLIVLALVAALANAIQASRYGRAMVAVRDDETAAAMTGINVTGVKVSAFALSGACAAIAGCLFASHVGFVAPEDFNFAHSITYLAMLIVGGEGTVMGAIVGAVLLTFLPEWLRFLGEAYLAFFGLMMLAILIFLPSGIVGIARRRPRGAAPLVTMRAPP